MTRISTVAALLMASLASLAITPDVQADTSKKVLLIMGDRYFLIDVSSGTPQIGELTNVVNIDAPPPPASTRAKVRTLTAATNDPLIAQAISQGVYQDMAGRVESGAVTFQQAQGIIKSATDLAVNQSDNSAAWATWRTEIGSLIDDLQRAGKLDEKAEQVQFLKDVAAGMNDAFPNAAIDLQQLLTLIRSIIELIISLVGNNAAVDDGATITVPPLSTQFVHHVRGDGGGSGGVGDSRPSIMWGQSDFFNVYRREMSMAEIIRARAFDARRREIDRVPVEPRSRRRRSSLASIKAPLALFDYARRGVRQQVMMPRQGSPPMEMLFAVLAIATAQAEAEVATQEVQLGEIRTRLTGEAKT